MSKKDKLLADAQKLLQKGQLDKAIACYQEALATDPGDIRLRQRLAELLTRGRRLDEARKEFEVIGRNLTSNGFFLKAIAVYKQIEKLFPEDISVALTLASLNEQHGLPANALAEYKRAYDYFEQQQNHGEALKALEAMQRIDSRNPNIKLKYAEVLYQQGKRDESLEAFRTLGLLLVDRNDDQAFCRLGDRLKQLFPDKNDITCSIVEQKIHSGSADQAAVLLQSMLKQNPQRLAAWRLLVEAYRQLGNVERVRQLCRHCIRLFPDEIFPRQTLISSLLDDQLVQEALALLDESEPVLLKAGAAELLRSIYLRLNDLVPINIRILKGCARACRAAGHQDEADSFAAKIGGLAGLAGGAQETAPVALASEPAVEPKRAEAPLEPVELLEVEADLPVAVSYEEPPSVAPEPEAGPRELDLDHFIAAESEQLPRELSLDQLLTAEPAGTGDDFYEIEVELDEEPVVAAAEPAQAWFETVHDLFDTIPTEAGKVRYGAELEQGDTRSCYDLGLAFYEMGLYDEAINMLRQADDDPQLRVPSLTLQGACLREKGEPERARTALQALLAQPSLSGEDTCAVTYELALTAGALGNQDEARRLLEKVSTVDPAFRDVRARLERGAADDAESFDFDEDDLLEFDLK